MKCAYLNNRIFLTCLFFVLALTCSFAQVSEKTHQTIITGGAEVLRLDIKDAEVNLKETKGTRILIETSIKLSVPNEALLNFVIKSGRYELSQKYDAGTREMVIATKKDKNVIVVKGEECYEKVVYDIFVPTSMKTLQN